MSMLFLLFGTGYPNRARGGSSISGGTFSRKRWHDLQEAKRLAREARLEAKALKQQELRETAKKAAQEAREKVLAARQAQSADWDRQREERQLAPASNALSSAQAIQELMRHAGNMAAMAHQHHAKMADDDEDEAIALLMMHE